MITKTIKILRTITYCSQCPFYTNVTSNNMHGTSVSACIRLKRELKTNAVYDGRGVYLIPGDCPLSEGDEI